MMKFKKNIIVVILLFSSVAQCLMGWPQLHVHYNYFDNKVLIINGKYGIWNGLNNIAVLSLWDYLMLKIVDSKPSNFLTYSTGRELDNHVFYDEKYKNFVLLRRLHKGGVLIEYIEDFNLKFVFNLGSVLNSQCHETDESSKRGLWPPYTFYADSSIDVDWNERILLIETYEGHEIKISLDEERIVSDIYKPELRSDYCKKHYQGPGEDYVFPDYIQEIYLLDQNDQERRVLVEDIFPERVKKVGMKMPTRCHYTSSREKGDRCKPIWGEGFEKKSRLTD